MPTSSSHQQQITIDASHQSLGRLASHVAQVIRGKRSATFAPNTIPHIRITISNIQKIAISDRKLADTTRKHVTRYPGGLKSTSWRESWQRDPQGFFLLTLKRMLPANKLRSRLLKLITFV